MWENDGQGNGFFFISGAVGKLCRSGHKPNEEKRMESVVIFFDWVLYSRFGFFCSFHCLLLFCKFCCWWCCADCTNKDIASLCGNDEGQKYVFLVSVYRTVLVHK